MELQPLRVVGLMSGTSADGVDAAVVQVGWDAGKLHLETLAAISLPYADDLRREILAACDPETGRVDRICRLNAVLGEWFAQAALQAVDAARLRPEAIDLIASHGQTVYHATQPGQDPPSTLQIAEPAVIAERTGRTVVAGFRARDVAAGGQGAPLMSYVDYLLFSDAERSRALQNLGGIANVTYLPAGGQPDAVIAFDSGPGNMVVDALAAELLGQPFDRDGRAAASGHVDEELLAELLADPYFARDLPKTTGREQFGAAYAARLVHRGRARGLGDDDLIATATALTARSIAEAYRRSLPGVDEVILSGGGAANPTLVSWLGVELEHVGISAAMRRPEEFGVSSDAKEAIGFAILGFETVHGHVGTLPTVTGARHPVVLGTITAGANYRELARLVGTSGETGRQTRPRRPLAAVEDLIESAIAREAFPGAALAVGRSNGTLLARGFGRLTTDPDAREVDLDTFYDLASLTKVIATTTMAMILVDEERLDLDAPVARYLTAFAQNGKQRVRVRDLLLHCSGLGPTFPGGFVAYAATRRLPRDRDLILAEACAQPLSYETGTQSIYSDLGFLALGATLEAIAGERLDRLVGRRVFDPLGMPSSTFVPSPILWPRVAPTERDPWRGHLLRGEVHDECAWMMGGVAPHAGLFSTGRDLARFADCLLRGGELGGTRILSSSTLTRFVRRDGSVAGSTRALGWDTASPEGSSGRMMSETAFGHTGFTGTSIWIDPPRELYVIFLTNRVYPSRSNQELIRFRPRLHDAVVAAVTGNLP